MTSSPARDVPGSAPMASGADPAAVGPYLVRVLGDAGWADCSLTLVAGGKSNLTYVVDSPAGRVVLRRPPLAAVLPTAHDMAREHRVLSALQGTRVPVPAVLHLCAEPEVIGAPFYVMEYVDGLVLRDRIPGGYADTEAERRAIAEGLVDVLVKIHAVPTDGALAGYGPPAGYLDRQLRRWVRQWEASREAAGLDLPDLDALAADLAASAPQQRETTLVHGDYRLDNTLQDPQRPGRVRAVLDWELSTLGDPLADVGLLGVYWSRSDSETSLVRTVTDLPGFPTRAEVLRLYSERSGRDVQALPWYVAFGYFKLAVIATGIAARARAGGMLGEGFGQEAASVPTLVASGRGVLDAGQVA